MKHFNVPCIVLIIGTIFVSCTTLSMEKNENNNNNNEDISDYEVFKKKMNDIHEETKILMEEAVKEKPKETNTVLDYFFNPSSFSSQEKQALRSEIYGSKVFNVLHQQFSKSKLLEADYFKNHYFDEGIIELLCKDLIIGKIAYDAKPNKTPSQETETRIQQEFNNLKLEDK